VPTRRQIRRRRTVALGVFVLVVAGAIAVALAAGGSSKHRSAHQASRVQRANPGPPPRHRLGAGRLILPSPLPTRTVTVPILMYHRVDTLSPALPHLTRALTVDPADFAAQMHWIAAHGFHAITQQQLWDALMKGTSLPRKPMMITFDDGYRDVFGKASTTIERLGLHATAYVITDRISGPDASFLTWGLLKGLERRGIEIGSHTIHHVELPTLSSAEARRELVGSRRLLERRLGHPVQWFAYPAGKVDARIVALVRRAGYVLAMTTRPGTTQSAAEPLLLHRYEIQGTTGVRGVAAILSNTHY
jgi:peptidoglycan/xylan/chitin deacetylase (PgdA/CDA1 family)